MREIGIHEARPILGDLVTAVEQGDEIILTRRGRPAARITAIREPRMPTATITIGDQTWCITGDDGQNSLAPTPRIIAQVDGVAVDLNCQYRQITSITHGAECTWGVALSPICTCAPKPADEEPLWDAARQVLAQCFAARDAAERAATQARQDQEDADTRWVRVPAGCDGCPSAMRGGVCTCC